MCLRKLEEIEVSLREIIRTAIKEREFIRCEVCKRMQFFSVDHSFTPEMCETEIEMRMESLCNAIEHLIESDREFILSNDRLRQFLNS